MDEEVSPTLKSHYQTLYPLHVCPLCNQVEHMSVAQIIIRNPENPDEGINLLPWEIAGVVDGSFHPPEPYCTPFHGVVLFYGLPGAPIQNTPDRHLLILN